MISTCEPENMVAISISFWNIKLTYIAFFTFLHENTFIHENSLFSRYIQTIRNNSIALQQP